MSFLSRSIHPHTHAQAAYDREGLPDQARLGRRSPLTTYASTLQLWKADNLGGSRSQGRIARRRGRESFSSGKDRATTAWAKVNPKPYAVVCAANPRLGTPLPPRYFWGTPTTNRPRV